MKGLTERCRMLREEAVNKKSYMKKFNMQRDVYFTLGVADTQGKGLSNDEMIAAGIVNTLEKFHPVIIPGELVTGVSFGDTGNDDGFFVNDDEEGRGLLRENGVSDAEADRYFAVKGKEFSDFRFAPKVVLTKEEEDSEKEWAAIGRCIDSNHSVIGYF